MHRLSLIKIMLYLIVHSYASLVMYILIFYFFFPIVSIGSNPLLQLLEFKISTLVSAKYKKNLSCSDILTSLVLPDILFKQKMQDVLLLVP